MGKGDRTWYTFYLATPSVEFARAWFEQHASVPAEQQVWLLSLDVEMIRTTRLDKDFREIFMGQPLAARFIGIFPKIIDSSKPTVYIPSTHLLFRTPLTLASRYTLQAFIIDVECVKELQAQFPPTNEFYINAMEVLLWHIDTQYIIARFRKVTKPTSTPVKQILLQGGLIGNVIMPVDLVEIAKDVKMKTQIRQGRGRPYTKGNIIPKHDPGLVKSLLPTLFDGKFLLQRKCRGDLRDEPKAVILSCDLATL